MLRCTIELLPGGDEASKRTIGVVEIANMGGDAAGECDYAVVLKKTPPYPGALRKAWREGMIQGSSVLTDATGGETDELIVGRVEGFHRVKRGCYDLLYLALRACGLDRRNP